MQLVFERGDYIDTNVLITLDELGVDGPERTDYAPSRWSLLPRALRGRRISPDDVFVDFGSGLGRVVCQAARRPFGRVVGVELSERLNAVARQNVERNRDRFACRDVELVNADVLTFDIPDDMTYAFFFNPFTGATFSRVIAKIVESLERAPRPLTLIYVNPVEGDQLERDPHFRRTRRLKRLVKRDVRATWVDVYEALPQHGVRRPAGRVATRA